MIKKSVSGIKSQSKDGATIPTKDLGPTGFYGRHNSSQITPRDMGAPIDPPVFSKKTGKSTIDTTGGL